MPPRSPANSKSAPSPSIVTSNSCAIDSICQLNMTAAGLVTSPPGQSLPATISLNLADIEHTISFRTRAEPILDLEIFDTLAKASAQRQQLELAYRKPGGKHAETRLVDPYHLANINGEWFLFAYDHA